MRQILIVLALLAAACSGSEAEPEVDTPESSSTSGDFDIDVTDEVTFLSLQGDDVRTSYLVRFRLSEKNGNPILGLDSQNFSVAKDGNPSTAENVKLPTNSLAKIDVALCLDNSLSIAVDPTGTPTPKNVKDLEDAAILFIDEIVDDADTLRLYKFSTASRTVKVGEYASNGTSWSNVGPGSTTPQQDVRSAIDPGQFDTGTALYQALNLALDDDPELEDFIVVFSDGVEEGSAPGSKAEALGRIEENKVVTFSVGVGTTASEDFLAISRFGDVFLSDTFAGVQASFETVANEVQSIYTILFDAPDQEGDHEIELTIRSGELNGRFTSRFQAGIDLALGSYYAPLSPGSFATYTDCAGLESLGTLTENCLGQEALTISDLGEARLNEDGVLHFEVQTTAGKMFVAPFGQGAISQIDGGPRRTLIPSSLEVGSTWRATPDDDIERRVVGIEDLTVAGFGYLGCFAVSVVDLKTNEMIAMEWYKAGVGLVRSEDLVGEVTSQLLALPSVSPTFF